MKIKRKSNLRPLMLHQKKALNWARERDFVALFMEMRLGKTLVAIRWASHIPSAKVLVVAPLSVLPTWEEELIKEGVSPKHIHMVRGSVSERVKIASARIGWFLINYEGVRVTPLLKAERWTHMILDESTRIRNPKAQITKLINKHFTYIRYRAILSGLPAPESPLDYFEQFKFLYGSFLSCANYWQFRNQFFNQVTFDWYPKRGTVELIKNTIHSKAFILTRKTVKLGSRKIYEKRYLTMEPRQLKAYKEVKKEFTYTTKTFQLMTKWATTRFVWMSRIAGGFSPTENILSSNKIKEIYNLLTTELAHEKVVVWFRFNQELFFCEQYLKAKGIRCAGIMGEHDLSNRQNKIHFFKEGKTQVLLVQLKCGKYGVDWSCASTAIYYSNSYEMEERLQSEDRLLHPMKKEPLLYIDLITKDTVDEDVVEALQSKKLDAKFFMTSLLAYWLKREGIQNKRRKP